MTIQCTLATEPVGRALRQIHLLLERHYELTDGWKTVSAGHSSGLCPVASSLVPMSSIKWTLLEFWLTADHFKGEFHAKCDSLEQRSTGGMWERSATSVPPGRLPRSTSRRTKAKRLLPAAVDCGRQWRLVRRPLCF